MAERIRLFAEHHIVAVRTGRRNGEIIAVKHATFGWISPQQYYGLQKLHDAMPLIIEFVKGGYLFKLALVNSNISIAGVSVPIGIGFYGTILGDILPIALAPIQEGLSHDELEAAQALQMDARIIVALMVLPWGDVLLPIYVTKFFADVAAGAGSLFAQPPSAPYTGPPQGPFRPPPGK